MPKESFTHGREVDLEVRWGPELDDLIVARIDLLYGDSKGVYAYGLREDDIDRLIKTLERAKRQYSAVAVGDILDYMSRKMRKLPVHSKILSIDGEFKGAQFMKTHVTSGAGIWKSGEDAFESLPPGSYVVLTVPENTLSTTGPHVKVIRSGEGTSTSVGDKVWLHNANTEDGYGGSAESPGLHED